MSAIDYRVTQNCAVITLTRPDRLNALTSEALVQLRDALASAERTQEVTGIVLTGAGRGFCSGMDVSSLVLSAQTGETALPPFDDPAIEIPGDRTMGADFNSGLTYFMSLRKPIIAAVNGPCAGMGLSLALCCDLRFASDEAAFVTSFARRGLIAEHGQSWLLPRVVGPSRALDLLWSSRRVDAAEAYRIGLVDQIVPAAELLPHVQAYIAALHKYSAPLSLMTIKRQVYRHLNMSLGEAFTETDALMRERVKHQDAKEGVESYLEKRNPRFARVDVA